MPKAPSKKLTAQKNNQPTPATTARRHGHRTVAPQEDATRGVSDDAGGSTQSKTTCRRSSRLQNSTTDVAASAATDTASAHITHPAPTAVPSKTSLKRKKNNRVSNEKNQSPAPPPKSLPRRETAPISTASIRTSPLTDDDAGDASQMLPNSEGGNGAQVSGDMGAGEAPQPDSEDVDEVPPPPPKRRRIAGAVPSSVSGRSSSNNSSSSNSNSNNSSSNTSARLSPNEQNESAQIRELRKELEREKGQPEFWAQEWANRDFRKNPALDKGGEEGGLSPQVDPKAQG
jgi:hypothetical protein